jgi:propionyl-CoA synthetase
LADAVHAVLDYSRPPFARWFVGGRTNLCHNAVDRHLAARGDQAALVYISTETGQEARYTYRGLARAVNACAARCASSASDAATACSSTCR